MPPVLSVAAAALLLHGAAGASPAGVLAGGTPYTDPDARGQLTFCDAGGHAITSGSTTDAPFAALTASSLAAASPYDGPMATATLVFKQPRQGVAPGGWSGETVGAGSRFPDAQHPAAATTSDAVTVGDMVEDFPPQVDGLLQVRLYLGAPDAGIQNTPYAATSIRVSGSTWTAVDPGGLSCSSVRATSVETLLGITPSPRASVAGASSPAPSGPPVTSVPTVSSAPSLASSPAASDKAGAVVAAGPSASSTKDDVELQRVLLEVAALGIPGLMVGLMVRGTGRQAAGRD